MLQILAMMFFSAAALAAMALIWAMLADNWGDVLRALGLDARTFAPPRPARARVSRARSPRPSALPRRPLRAAA